MEQPEEQTRARIDQLLSDAGWVIQDRSDFNRHAALGVAVREFHLPAGYCDYLLFIDGKAAGVIEAKKAGVTLSDVAGQSAKYVAHLPEHLPHWEQRLVSHYESAAWDRAGCGNRSRPGALVSFLPSTTPKCCMSGYASRRPCGHSCVA